MSEPEESLEALIRRPEHQATAIRLPPPAGAADALGQCVCGARIAWGDVYGQRGDADLGRPSRRPAARFLQYRCPLCGQTGELAAEGEL